MFDEDLRRLFLFVPDFLLLSFCCVNQGIRSSDNFKIGIMVTYFNWKLNCQIPHKVYNHLFN